MIIISQTKIKRRQIIIIIFNDDIYVNTKIKKKRVTIPRSVRYSVWRTYNKEMDAECFIKCGNMISVENFECGHVIAHKNGGNINIENLRPICSCCNKSMGTMNMNDFINQYYGTAN